MEAVVAACLLTPVLITAHVLLFRGRRPNTHVYVHLLPAWGIHCVAWLAVMLCRGPVSVAQCIAGLSMNAFICLSYGQAFSLVVRGFSLRMLVDIDERGELNMEQIIAGYGSGRGLDWMFEKRLAALESLGLVRREAGKVVLTRRGRRAGVFCLWSKRVINIGPGG